jgi:hypothetical protein
MSLIDTKKQLQSSIKDEKNKVIAISGKWGTGKTYLWEEIKTESPDERVKNALYLSLFGLSTIEQVKRKLIEVSMPGVEENKTKFEALKDILNIGIKAAEEKYRIVAAIRDFNFMLGAPIVLKSKVIVIDDIERKHSALGIDEVLGFIDEYSKQFNSRFILVLNDDQLTSDKDQAKLWETFREKVIDHEVKLATSVDEAFEIAIKLEPTQHSKALKRAANTCSLTNIRIITKIIRVANQVLGNQSLEDAVQSRLIPSIVLFSAIHYRGIDDGPDFEFALKSAVLDYRAKKDSLPTERQIKEDRWKVLVRELGIYSCSEFENLLVDFFESGIFNEERFKEIISIYRGDHETLKAQETARLFIRRVYWDQSIDDAGLLIEAIHLPNIARFLDMYTVTDLAEYLNNVSGGEILGQSIVDNWIAEFRTKKTTAVNLDFIDDFVRHDRKVHPKIESEFNAIKQKTQASTTVKDAVFHIIEKSGWGTLQNVALRNSTASDFESAIRSLDFDNLSPFMRRMMEISANKESFQPSFGDAGDRFLEACITIANDKTSPRISNIIKRIFTNSTMADKLVPKKATRTKRPPSI